jgi:multidrug efflux pump subunit AcrA (membrane-fusion protein)
MDHKRLAIAALAATVALAGCGKGAQQRGPMALNVDVAAAQRRDIATYITLDGQIAPLEQSTLAFQQSAPITTITVNVGDVVHRGQLLAQIDPSTLKSQLAQAQAQAAQQSATANGAQVGLPVQKMQNETAISTAQASLRNTKLVYDQDQQLYKQGYVSQAQLEAAHAAYVQAQSNYQNAQIGIRNNVVSEQNVKASVAGAQAAQAQAGVLQTQISQTSLYAPYDGVITQRLMDPGAFASPSAPVLAISRVDTVWVNINVPDEDLNYVRPGSNVTFTSSSLPDKKFSSKIQTVNAVPTQGTLSYLARIALANPGDVLRGGMLITATLPKESKSNTIVVPRTAIAQTANGNSVFIVNGNKAEEVPVRIGVQTDTLSEVLSPRVQAGTQVITTRPDALKDGSVVAVASSGGGSNASSAPNAGGSENQ